MNDIIERYEAFVMYFIEHHAIGWLFTIEAIIATFGIGVVTIISKVVTIMVGRPGMIELIMAWAVVYLMAEHFIVMLYTEEDEVEEEDK